MKKGLGLLMPLFLMACSQQVTISKDTLKDKIAGGWAGKMIGVSYGLPTEFKALGKMYEDSIHWTPVRVKDALWEDDLYVQLTLMDVMDKHGMQAEQKKYQEALATAGFRLWHANVQTRKNYFDSIFPPQSGQPEFNLHADDIDFQIEADYIGFMCPGMPQTANKMADYMGHIMNYGDGVYGGAFVASLYSEAYLQNDIRSVIEKALLSLPAESGYRRIIEDVIAFHQENPDVSKFSFPQPSWQKHTPTLRQPSSLPVTQNSSLRSLLALSTSPFLPRSMPSRTQLHTPGHPYSPKTMLPDFPA